MESAVLKEVTLVNLLGLHARAAAKFVKAAAAFDADVTLKKGGMEVNGKSIMGVIMLAIPVGESFIIKTCGKDTHEAAKALVNLVERKFDEDE